MIKVIFDSSLNQLRGWSQDGQLYGNRIYIIAKYL